MKTMRTMLLTFSWFDRGYPARRLYGAVLLLLFLLSCRPVLARQERAPEPTVALLLRDAPVTRALAQVFAQAGCTYRFEGIDSRRVSGVFSGRLAGVPVSVAVAQILRTAQPHVALRRDRMTGVYILAPAPVEVLTTVRSGEGDRRFMLPAQDAQVVVNTGHAEPVDGIAFSPDGRLLVTNGGDTTFLWDVASQTCIASLPQAFWQFSADGRFLYDSYGGLWDVAAEHLVDWRAHLPPAAMRVFAHDAISPSGDTACVFMDSNVSLVNVASGAVIRTLSTDFQTSDQYSPDGSYFTQWDDVRRRNGIYDAKTGQLLWNGQPVKRSGLKEWFRWDSEHGHLLVLRRADGNRMLSVIVCEARRGRMLAKYQILTDGSEDDQYEVERGHLIIRQIKSTLDYDATTGKLLGTLPYPMSASLTLSPDGVTIATADGSEVDLRDRRTGTITARLRRTSGPLNLARFSDDGAALLTAPIQESKGRLAVTRWDLATARASALPSAQVVPLYPWSTYAARPIRHDIHVTQDIYDDTYLTYYLSPDAGKKRWWADNRRPIRSPDGTQSIVVDEQARAYLLNAAAGTRRALRCPPSVDGGYPPRAGRKFLHEGEARLLGAAFTTKADRVALIWQTGGLLQTPFDRADRFVYPFLRETYLVLLDTQTLQEVRRWRLFTEHEALLPLFRPGDDALCLYGETIGGPNLELQRRGLWMVDCDTGELSRPGDRDLGTGDGDAVLSPNGALMATIADDRLRRTIWDGKTDRPYRSQPITREDRPSEITIWDLRTGQPIAHLKGHSGRVTDMAFRKDGRLLATASVDRTLRLWRTDDGGSEIARFTATDDGEYLACIPENYYTSSRGASRFIAFRAKDDAGQLRTYPFEQFDLKLNRPDLVLERIGYAAPKSIERLRNLYRKRLQQTGYDESVLGSDFHVPILRIDDKQVPFTTRARTVTFRLDGNDSREPLDRVDVWVNGVPAFGRSGIPLREKAVTAWSGAVTVALSEGTNRIQVAIRNRQGAESRRQVFSVACTPPDHHAPTLYVLTVGVSRYADTQVPALGYAAKDAGDIVGFFAHRIPAKPGSKYPFGQVKTLALTDEQATREAIRTKGGAFLAGSQVDDTVIVFFSGHGVMDRSGGYYFLCRDAQVALADGRPAITHGGLPFEEIEDLLYGAPARRRLLLLDSCHSGEADREAIATGNASSHTGGADTAGTVQIAQARHLPEGVTVRSLDFGAAAVTSGSRPTGAAFSDSLTLIEDLFANLKSGSGATVISAAGWQEYAWETGALKNGLFTHAVLTGLEQRDADTDHNGAILVSELRRFVTRRVLELSAGGQRPSSREENLDADFPID